MITGDMEERMVKTGKVVSCYSGSVRVCFERPEACAKCGQCGDIRETLVTLKGTAAPGDMVEVFLPEGQLLKYTLAAYVIPLVGLLLGLFLGKLLFGNETGEIITALCLGALTAIPVVMYDRRVQKSGKGVPRIIKVHPHREGGGS